MIEDLHRHWDSVRERLAAARSRLPGELLEDPAQGSLERFHEWLAHNELELALDELEGLGDLNTVPADFWSELRAAAELMKLTEHARRYAQREEER